MIAYNATSWTKGMDAQKAKVAILISYKLKWSHLFVYAPGVFLRRVDDAQILYRMVTPQKYLVLAYYNFVNFFPVLDFLNAVVFETHVVSVFH